MYRSRKPLKPPTEVEMLALSAEIKQRFPCKSWHAELAAADGSVQFECDCGAASGRYASHAEGEQILGEHLDEVHAGRVAHFENWVHQRSPGAMSFFSFPEPEQRRADHIVDRIRRRPEPEPAWLDDFPRVEGPHRSAHAPGPQYGLAHLLVYRLALVGVVSTPIAVLADTLGLRLEQSFGESADCEVAYFEHKSDAFALVRWATTENVEVMAYIGQGLDGRGLPELERFLGIAGLTWDDVVFPRPGERRPMVVET